MRRAVGAVQLVPGDRRDRGGFVHAGTADVGIHRACRDEGVVIGGRGQSRGSRADDVRVVAGRVDDGVEGYPREPVEVVLTIAHHGLDLREETGRALAAVEVHDLVTPGECALRQVPPEEHRPTEDENPHIRASSVPSSSRLARLWPEMKRSMYGRHADIPRASGS